MSTVFGGLLGLLALLLAACVGQEQFLIGEYTPARSFVLVTLDTTRPDHLSPYGARDVETPSLQALADAGAVLENAYAATPVTLPSHATLLTGLDPLRHGVRNNGLQALGEEATTLGEILRDAGFDTAAFVSAAVLERRWGVDQGFAVFDDDLAGGKPKELRMIAERPASVTVDAALAWLEERMTADEEDERFFLWLHLFDPHAPYEPPEPWASRFAERPYDGEIAAMDHYLGRLLAHAALDEDETLVMALADHGESLGQHGEASHAMLVYDATIRIPWILRGPGIAPGARPEVPVGQVDLLPTALELLGLADRTPEDLDGVSRAPVLAATDPASLGQAARDARAVRDLYAETFVPFYTYGWSRLRSLRRGPWKYIQAPAPELYDVVADPGELDNRFEDQPDHAAELAAALAQRVGRAEPLDGDREGGGDGAAAVDAETRERLRSLGYLASRVPTDDRPDAERPDPKAMIGVHRAMDRADHLLYSRQFEAAVRELRRVLSQDRGNLAALESLAKALGELGRTDEALAALDRALERAPEDAGLHLTRAGLEVARDQPEAALPALDAALALDPGFVDARVEKARVLLDLAARGEDPIPAEERRAEARDLLAAVLDEDPDNARAAVVWAKVAEGDGETVETRLERATTAEPYLAEGWRALGRARQRRGDVAGAVETYRRGLEFQPRDAGLRALLGLALAEQAEGPEDLREARDQLEQARTLSPRPLAQVHDGLAAVAAAEGSWNAAQREARRAVELDPALVSAWNHLAVALEEQGKTAEALEAYRRAAQVDPGHWQAVFNRGLLLRRLERLGEAEAAFRRVLELEPDHAAAHYELGVLYGATGREALARRELEAARRADPAHPRVEAIERLLGLLGG